MLKFFSLALALALLVGVGLGLKRTVMAKTETAPYQSVKQEGAIEIRTYPPLLVAETETMGSSREAAANEAFRRLAGYIFGKNKPKASLAMTAPVLQEKTSSKLPSGQGERLAMTAPVTEEALRSEDGSQRWRMRFVMPAGYTLETLPKPDNDLVSLLELPVSKVLAVRFSGVGNDAALAKHRQQLEAYAKAKGLTLKGEPIAAFYNDPFTLPFLRRNEVLWHLAD